MLADNEPTPTLKLGADGKTNTPSVKRELCYWAFSLRQHPFGSPDDNRNHALFFEKSLVAIFWVACHFGSINGSFAIRDGLRLNACANKLKLSSFQRKGAEVRKESQRLMAINPHSSLFEPRSRSSLILCDAWHLCVEKASLKMLSLSNKAKSTMNNPGQRGSLWRRCRSRLLHQV